MTVATTSARIDYTGDGVTLALPVPFQFFAASDLVVIRRVDATGVETLLALNTDYTVTGGAGSTGTVTQTTATAVGTTLSIQRAVGRVQETDYVSNDLFPAETHERALDRLTLVAQDHDQRLSMTLRAPRSDQVASLEVPAKVARADKLLAFDGDGNAVAVPYDTSAIRTPGSASPSTGTWTFAADGARNNGLALNSGQFYFQQDSAGAIIRCQGVDGGAGEQVGFLTSGYSAASPPVLVMHRDRGTRVSPAAVQTGDFLGVWSLKGTIQNSGLQGVGAYIRGQVTENTAVTGTLGTDLLLQVCPIGGVVPTTITFRISHDTGLSYKGFPFVNSSGHVVGAQHARNYASNPAFDLWQAGTSFTVAANTNTQLADRWKTRRTTTGLTMSRQAGFSGAEFCLRWARDAGTSDTASMQLWHHIPTEIVRRLAGRTIWIALDVRAGANYSGGALAGIWYSGTAGGEALTMTGAGIGFPTGAANSSSFNLGTPAVTAARVVSASGYTIPTNALDLALRLFWTPSGTAGAADWLEVTNVRLAEDAGTAFFPPPLDEVRADCERYYQKSFALNTAPAQNAGAGTGEVRFQAVTAGATTQRAPSVRFPVRMRGTPAITLFNPAAANAQIRDLTAGADCSAAATTNVTEAGFDLTATGNAGTAAGNHLGFHWVADARL